MRLTVGNAISLKRLESLCRINPRMAEIIWTNAQDCKGTFALNAKKKTLKKSGDRTAIFSSHPSEVKVKPFSGKKRQYFLSNFYATVIDFSF